MPLRRLADPRLRPLLLILSALVATTGLVVLTPRADAANADVRINEVESNGDATDWIELTNVGTATVDVSGWILKDNMDSRTLAIPSGTTIAPGAFLAVDVDVSATAGNFGLGAADSARVYLANGTTLIDTYSWTAHATTTYGRCPDGTGAFTTTTLSTKGAANNCGTTTPPTTTPPTTTPPTTTPPTTTAPSAAAAWPGGQTVTPVDPTALVTSNLSGLVYEGATDTDPGTLWAVQNGPGTLFKLQQTGATWGPVAGDWAAGKTLRYTAAGTTATENPDAEGVTITDAGSKAGIFVSTERNNAVSAVSRPAVLRFDPDAAGTTLAPSRTWDLTSDLPVLGANLSLEGVTWVPDSYLVANGFRTAAGATYVPADYPGHGTGLFFVGVEGNGMVYGYALNQDADTFTRVTSFASGFPAVMELNWEPETQKLWVVCDDTCQGRSTRFGIDASGAFAPVATYERPSGMANLNNEGFATTPRSECVGGLKPQFWADDSDTGGNSLRQGTLSCTVAPTPTVTVTAQPSPVAAPAAPLPVPAVDVRAPRVRVVGVSNGGRYPAKQPKPRCRATDDVAVAFCSVDKQRVQLPGPFMIVFVTATAVDTSSNIATARKSYLARG